MFTGYGRNRMSPRWRALAAAVALLVATSTACVPAATPLPPTAPPVLPSQTATPPAPTTTPTASAPTTTPSPTPPPIALERLELVTADAATGNGGNAWGGHQTRIVRPRMGVFTAYTVSGPDEFRREWRLAQRTDQGWRIIAQGPSGTAPVNLLQGPDGRLYIVAWPDGLQLGPPTKLPLPGYRIVYSGPAIGAPRGGVPLADYVDGVFPSGEGEKWVYFRLRLRSSPAP